MPITSTSYTLKCTKCDYSITIHPKDGVYDSIEPVSKCPKCGEKIKLADNIEIIIDSIPNFLKK